VPVGFRVKLTPGMVMTAACGPARISGERLANGPFGAIVGRLGLRAAVATPVVAGDITGGDGGGDLNRQADQV
jgi:hypothetical protein